MKTTQVQILFCTALFLSVTFATVAHAETFGNTSVGSNTYPGADLERIGAVTLGSDDPAWSAVVDPAGEYLYVPVAYQPKIYKINLSTFAIDDTITFASNEYFDNSPVVDIDPSGSFLYAATAGYPTKVIKVDLGTFTRTATTTLGADHGSVYSLEINNTGDKAYVGVFPNGAPFSPNFFTEIDLGTFSTTTTLTLSSGETNIRDIVIDPSDEFAYLMTRTTNGYVIKVRLSDMVRIGALDPRTELGLFYGLSNKGLIDENGDFLYVMSGGSALSKIDLSDFSFSGGIIPSNFPEVYDIVLSTSTNTIYLPTYTSPGRVAGISTDSFTQVSTTTLEAGDISSEAIVIDPAGRYLYVMNESYPGTVTKVALPTLLSSFPQGKILASKVTLSEDASTVDSVSVYSHVADGTVRLALYNSNKQRIWESNDVTNTQGGGWITVSISNGEPMLLQNLSAGTYYIALQVNSTSDVPSYIAGSSGDGLTLDQSYGSFSNLSSATENTQTWSSYVTYTPLSTEVSASQEKSSSRRSSVSKEVVYLQPEGQTSDFEDSNRGAHRQLLINLIELLKTYIEILKARQGL